jgi:hypothetical protein
MAVERYLHEMGIEINVACTGDSTVASLKQVPGGFLNLVQCTGSMHYVARLLEEEFGTPYIDVNFFGAYNTADSLRRIAQFYGEPHMIGRQNVSSSEKLNESGLISSITAPNLPENVLQSMWGEHSRLLQSSGNSGNLGWRLFSVEHRPENRKITNRYIRC